MVVKGRHFSYQKNVGQAGPNCLSKADLRIPTFGWYGEVAKGAPPKKKTTTKSCLISNKTRTNDLPQPHPFLFPLFFNNIQAKTDENNIGATLQRGKPFSLRRV